MLDETAAAPPPTVLDAPADDGGLLPLDTLVTEEEGQAIAQTAVDGIIRRDYTLRNAAEVLPEAVQGEGGPLALMGDPPLSTNTETGPGPGMQSPMPVLPPPEPTVEVAKKLFLPVRVVRTFFNPECPSKCQEGALGTRVCWCAIKRCRDIAQKMREQARAQQRAQPAAPAHVNERSLDGMEKLAERAARLDEQIKEAEAATADEIAALVARADAAERDATLYTQGIRQAEEGLEGLAGRKRDREQEAEERKRALEQELRDAQAAAEQDIAAMDAAAADVTTKLDAARSQESKLVRAVSEIRAAAKALEAKRDKRTAGMRNERARLERRIRLRLAHHPEATAAPQVSPAPAPATPPNTCSHGQLIGDPCAGCEAVEAARRVENGDAPPLPPLDAPVVESSSPPESRTYLHLQAAPTASGAGLVGMNTSGEVIITDGPAPAAAGPPEEKTPVVEVLVPAEASPGPGLTPAERQAAEEASAVQAGEPAA